MRSCDTGLYVNVTMVSPQQWTLCPNIWHAGNLAMIALEVNSTKSLEKLWPTFWCRTLYSKVFEDLVIQAMHHCLWWRKFLYNQVLVYVFLLNFPAVFSLYFHALSAVFPDTAAGHCICAKEREYIMGPWRYMRGGGTYDVCTKTALHQIGSILEHQNVWCSIPQKCTAKSFLFLVHYDIWFWIGTLRYDSWYIEINEGDC